MERHNKGFAVVSMVALRSGQGFTMQVKVERVFFGRKAKQQAQLYQGVFVEEGTELIVQEVEVIDCRYSHPAKAP